MKIQEIAERLAERPASWSQVLASRVALRLLPETISSEEVGSPGETREHWILSTFRAALIAWAANNYPSYDMAISAASAGREIPSTPNAAARAAFFVAYPDRDVANTVAFAVDASVKNSKDLLWKAISYDLGYLERRAKPSKAASHLSSRPLWPLGEPDYWQNELLSLRRYLEKWGPSFRFWTDWFERRIKGENASFVIPEDLRRREDKWLLRQIAEAANEDFWDRGADFVNDRLSGWLEEARERAAKNFEEPFSPLTDTIDNSVEPKTVRVPVPLPPPGENALQFGHDGNGRVTLAPSAGSRALKTDADARDRHELALEDAKALLAACEGSNSAERLSSILQAYLQAAGESIETMRPSAFVQRGERLRQELAKYEAPDTDLPPLSDAIITDLGSACKAHNMVVGLDPVLLDLDTAQLGPDRQIGDATPAELRDVTKEADEAQILSPEVPEMMFEAVDLVPEGAGPEDRRFRWCMESGRNLIIEAFALALNHPIKTASTTAVTAYIGPTALVGNALAAALFLYHRREWVEEKLGRHAPTWKHLFEDLCNRLEATKKEKED